MHRGGGARLRGGVKLVGGVRLVGGVVEMGGLVVLLQALLITASIQGKNGGGGRWVAMAKLGDGWLSREMGG
jgi:hypothetical protein